MIKEFNKTNILVESFINEPNILSLGIIEINDNHSILTEILERSLYNYQIVDNFIIIKNISNYDIKVYFYSYIKYGGWIKKSGKDIIVQILDLNKDFENFIQNQRENDLSLITNILKFKNFHFEIKYPLPKEIDNDDLDKINKYTNFSVDTFAFTSFKYRNFIKEILKKYV